MIINKDLIGKKFANCSFINFFEVRGNELAIEACKKVADGTSLGAVLIGPPGRGKTHLLVATMFAFNRDREVEINSGQNAIIKEEGRRIVYWPHKELTANLRAGAVTGGNREIVWICKQCDLLALDDFGSEKPTEFVVESLEEILDYRYRNELRTLISTNLDLNTVGAIYGPRIVSRWIEDYDIVQISTKDDYRQKIAATHRNGKKNRDI